MKSVRLSWPSIVFLKLEYIICFIKYDIQGVFLKCAEILPTRLFDNVED
jgi:hypothetical protein